MLEIVMLEIVIALYIPKPAMTATSLLTYTFHTGRSTDTVWRTENLNEHPFVVNLSN